jgi:predicted AAA+ superfamily ATPase
VHHVDLRTELLQRAEQLRRFVFAGWAEGDFDDDAAAAEIDLLIERGATRIGLEFKAAASATPADARSLRIGMADGVITRGLVVCAGTRRYPLDKQIAVVGADELLTSAAARGDW